MAQRWTDDTLLMTRHVARVLQVSKSGVRWLANEQRLRVWARTVDGWRLFRWRDVRECEGSRAAARVTRPPVVVVSRSPVTARQPRLPYGHHRMAKASLHTAAVKGRGFRREVA